MESVSPKFHRVFVCVSLLSLSVFVCYCDCFLVDFDHSKWKCVRRPLVLFNLGQHL